jgi:hypothetical protein
MIGFRRLVKAGGNHGGQQFIPRIGPKQGKRENGKRVSLNLPFLQTEKGGRELCPLFVN